jgi:hypothetical protein
VAANSVFNAEIDRRSFLIAATELAAVGKVFAVAQACAQDVGADLALALAADCSGSVTPENYALQQRGYAEAFRDHEIIEAIRSGPGGSIMVCYFQWSGYDAQQMSIPWTLLNSRESIAHFASRLDEADRTIYSGGTAPAGAIAFGHKLLMNLPTKVARKVIDISGDGRTNNGPPPEKDRDEALADGITINGLPILHLEPDIEDYYKNHLIGGPGAFIVPAVDFNAFGEAIRRKFMQEIAGRAPSSAVKS